VTEDEATHLVAMLQAAYQHTEFRGSTGKLYLEVLLRWGFEDAILAVQDMIQTRTFPSVADLVTCLEERKADRIASMPALPEAGTEDFIELAPEEVEDLVDGYFQKVGVTEDEVGAMRADRASRLGDKEAKQEHGRAKARAMEDAWREQQGLDKGEEPERQRLNPGICAGTGKEAIREGDEWVCPDCKGPVTFIEPKAAKKAKSA
jgi:rubredoxin